MVGNSKKSLKILVINIISIKSQLIILFWGIIGIYIDLFPEEVRMWKVIRYNIAGYGCRNAIRSVFIFKSLTRLSNVSIIQI